MLAKGYYLTKGGCVARVDYDILYDGIGIVCGSEGALYVAYNARGEFAEKESFQGHEDDPGESLDLDLLTWQPSPFGPERIYWMPILSLLQKHGAMTIKQLVQALSPRNEADVQRCLIALQEAKQVEGEIQSGQTRYQIAHLVVAPETVDTILAKLQRHRGYRGWRIQPHPFNTAVFLAETYTFIGRGNKKGWRSLWDEKRNPYRTFPSPEQAYEALLTMQKESDDMQHSFETE